MTDFNAHPTFFAVEYYDSRLVDPTQVLPRYANAAADIGPRLVSTLRNKMLRDADEHVSPTEVLGLPSDVTAAEHDVTVLQLGVPGFRRPRLKGYRLTDAITSGAIVRTSPRKLGDYCADAVYNSLGEEDNSFGLMTADPDEVIVFHSGRQPCRDTDFIELIAAAVKGQPQTPRTALDFVLQQEVLVNTALAAVTGSLAIPVQHCDHLVMSKQDYLDFWYDARRREWAAV